MELNGKVLNALHMYSSLMKDTPVYTPFKPQDMQYNMQAYINNYAPLDQSFNEQQLLKNTPIDTNSSVLPNQAHNSTNNLLPQGSNLKQNIPQLYSTEDQHLNLNPDSSNQKLEFCNLILLFIISSIFFIVIQIIYTIIQPWLHHFLKQIIFKLHINKYCSSFYAFIIIIFAMQIKI